MSKLWKGVPSLSLLLAGCVFGTDSGAGGDAGTSTGGAPAQTSTGVVGTTTTGSSSQDGTGTSGGDSTSTSTGGSSSDGGEDAESSGSSSTGEPPSFELCDDSDPDLRACYDFAIEDDVLVDLSMHGNDGVALDVDVEPGPLGTAARVGSSGIEVDDSPSLDIVAPISFEAWFNLDGIPPESERYGILDNEAQYSLIVIGGEGIRCAGGGRAWAETYPTRQWIHVACVNDGTGMQIYLDGDHVSTADSSFPVNTRDPEPLAIGDTSPFFSEPFEGLLGGLRIWSVARTPEQIAEAAAAIR